MKTHPTPATAAHTPTPWQIHYGTQTGNLWIESEDGAPVINPAYAFGHDYRTKPSPRRAGAGERRTMSAACFILAERRKGKWVALAGTNSGGCLAASETVFAYHGLKKDGAEIHWGENLVKQKNFGGYAPTYVPVELAEHARKLHWFKCALAQPWYKTLAQFLETFPDAAPFAKQLSAIKP